MTKTILSNTTPFKRMDTYAAIAFSILAVSADNLEIKSPVFLESKNSQSLVTISSKTSYLS